MKKLIPILLFVLFLTACGSNILLPDLTGKTETEVVSQLESLNLEVEIVYDQDMSIDHGTFIRYEIGYATGAKVDKGQTVTVYIARNGYILPDLSGKTETEAITTLNELGLTYELSYENNFTKEDLEFNRYLDFSAGDLLPLNTNLTVMITWNGGIMPELSGRIKAEIIEALEYEFIYNYDFEYILNDAYPEDTFAGYKDTSAGMPADEEGTIIVYLYKNSFTDDETSLFISKYLHGTGSNAAIEIYNPFDVSVDLADYHLAIFLNGSFEVGHRIQLSGILESESTHLVVYTGSNAQLRGLADQQSSRLLFDGNDVIQLRYKNDTYIDTIYELGNMLFVMENELFIRDNDIMQGHRTFNLSQWHGYVPQYLSALGSHPHADPTSFSIDMTFANNDFFSTSGGMRLVTVGTINDGDTAHFSPGFEGNQRMRFLGVDTPETHPVVEPWGLEAKDYVIGMLTQPGVEIYVQSDPAIGAVDTYGRTLGLVWVNGELLNYLVVRNGYSFNYYSRDSRLVFENRYLFRWMQDAENQARAEGLGIHS